METPVTEILSVRPSTVESKARRRENRRGPQPHLAHLNSIRLLFRLVSVPVVQRIEQGFSKGKTAFLLEFADVVSTEQMTALKRVE